MSRWKPVSGRRNFALHETYCVERRGYFSPRSRNLSKIAKPLNCTKKKFIMNTDIPSFLVLMIGAWKVNVFRLSNLVLGSSSTNAGRTRLASISCLALACILRWWSVKAKNIYQLKPRERANISWPLTLWVAFVDMRAQLQRLCADRRSL